MKKSILRIFFMLIVFFSQQPSYGDELSGSELIVQTQPGFNFKAISGLDELTITKLAEFKNSAFFLVRSSIKTAKALGKELLPIPGVERVERNYRRQLQRLPADPKFSRQWGLEKIMAPAAWELQTGQSNIIVAILDSGVDYLHPDLQTNIFINQNEIPANGIDDDANGYIDDYYGYDFAANNSGGNDPNPIDSDGHGTHVAGIIGATGNNNLGVCGVNWRVGLLSLKVTRPDGYIYDSDVLEALNYIYRMKGEKKLNIVAINASYGGSNYSSAIETAIREMQKINIVFVAAAGNGGEDNIGDDLDQTPFYPACYELNNVLAVAALQSNDKLTSFSNFGRFSVDIAAPGEQILSTVMRNKGNEAFLILNGQELPAKAMEFSGHTPSTGLLGRIVFCQKGINLSDFPPAVSGNIALIERGEITFAEKTQKAMQRGAVGVIIYNNQPGNFNGTLQTDAGWVPVISVSDTIGALLRANNGNLLTLFNIGSDYAEYNGTSMATPFVSGAIALIAANYPQDNYQQRIARLLAGGTYKAELNTKLWSGMILNLNGALSKNPEDFQFSAERKTWQGWLQSGDYALLKITVRPGVQFTRCVVFKAKSGSDFAVCKEISRNEFKNNSFQFVDLQLEKNNAFFYRIMVYDSSGQLTFFSLLSKI